ncbi:MAG TPA: acyl carrier protein [Firmicutes bacterium]|nr:acyl carrier protein [Bacillota bacterium]
MEDREKVRQIFKEMSADKIEVADNMDLQLDLGFDSLRLVEAIVELENAFEIEFNLSDLNPDKLRTVNDIYMILNI